MANPYNMTICYILIICNWHCFINTFIAYFIFFVLNTEKSGINDYLHMYGTTDMYFARIGYNIHANCHYKLSLRNFQK